MKKKLFLRIQGPYFCVCCFLPFGKLFCGTAKNIIERHILLYCIEFYFTVSYFQHWKLNFDISCYSGESLSKCTCLVYFSLTQKNASPPKKNLQSVAGHMFWYLIITKAWLELSCSGPLLQTDLTFSVYSPFRLLVFTPWTFFLIFRRFN